MSRGDGKVKRGHTRGVKKMAVGGALAGRDAAMGGAAPGSRAEASRGTSSSGGSSMGGSSSSGGFGGGNGGGNRGGDNLAARDAAMGGATPGSRAEASRPASRGPSAGSMLGSAGRDGRGGTGAESRLATYNPDGTITYSSRTPKGKQFYDRILPEATEFPPTGFGPFSPKTGYVPKMEGTPISTSPTMPSIGGFGPFSPRTGYTPRIDGTVIDTGWNAATGTFDRPQASPTTPSPRPSPRLSPRLAGPMFPNREGGGGRDDRRTKRRRPIDNPNFAGGGREGARGGMSDGGTVRGDGKTVSGKTKGRMV